MMAIRNESSNRMKSYVTENVTVNRMNDTWFKRKHLYLHSIKRREKKIIIKREQEDVQRE